MKIYDCDGNSTSEFKVNTWMEFIGVYSVDPTEYTSIIVLKLEIERGSKDAILQEPDLDLKTKSIIVISK